MKIRKNYMKFYNLAENTYLEHILFMRMFKSFSAPYQSIKIS